MRRDPPAATRRLVRPFDREVDRLWTANFIPNSDMMSAMQFKALTQSVVGDEVTVS